MPNSALLMKVRFASCLYGLLVSLLMTGCAAPPVSDAPSLEGRWRNTSGKVHFSDGSTAGPVTACWVEFFKDRSISECTASRGKDRIVYAYRMLSPGQYESEVLENKNFPQYVGTRIRTEFRIENGVLFTISLPPAPKGGASKYPVKAEATWVRD